MGSKFNYLAGFQNGFTALPNQEIDYLDELLLKDGLPVPVSADELRRVPIEHLQIWGNKRGVYTIPTTELIEWLKEEIGGRKAIEICAGTGVIGRALDIRRTDSYIQTTPEVILLYQSMSQVPIHPPKDVYQFEANHATDLFRPKVVVGSYVTQKYVEGDENTKPKTNSSIYGVDEMALLPKIETYITIGNSSTHGDKRIRQFPHKVYQFDWLFTRSTQPELNEIVVWNK